MNKSLETRVEKLKEEFKKIFGKTKDIQLFNAPGRVNIIGEHTDYNGGYVLPVAINLGLLAAAGKRNDRKVCLESLNFKKKVVASLDVLKYEKKNDWANYPLSVAWVLGEEGIELSGADIIFEGNIPVASGLSSSAAIEVLTMKCLLELSDRKIKKERIPLLCRKAENEFIGVKSGVMDQYIVTFGKKNNALFLNCKTLEHKLIPFHNIKDTVIMIGNTKVKRGLAKSAYNERVAECNEGLKILRGFITRGNIGYLSDIKKEEFREYKNYLPPIIAKRCEHVIFENERVKQAVESLEKGDVDKLGKLMIRSHKSLKELYEVSCKELNIMVETFLESDGVYGARMTGAGFGGCAIALIKQDAQEEIIKKASKEYKKRAGIKGEFYVSRISDGVRKL
ncbi:galactokinase [candidate division WOR-3 bacterium]|nr:galactokinase [candidate division WOR-3 bacterium]